MEMNKNGIQGKWTEIKGEVKKAWGKLTDDEIEQTKGDMTSIKGLLQQRYGKAEGDYHEKLNGIFERFKDKKEAAVEGIKEKIRPEEDKKH